MKSKSIAKGAVGSKQIKGKSIRGNRLKDGAKLLDAAVITAKILDGAITSQEVAEGGLNSSDLSDLAVLSGEGGGLVRVTATDAATEAAGRVAAPETTLLTKGDLRLTAKCFRSIAGDQTFAEIYIRTATNGAVFDGEDELSGGPVTTDFLNTDTALGDSRIDSISATGSGAAIDEDEFTAIGPDGTHLLGQTTVAAKNGTLADDGVYGTGNVCLFGGEIAG